VRQADKYEGGMFGSCPRVYCQGTNVVPCGRSDVPGVDTVKLFCPNCCDIYSPPSSRFQGVDGARALSLSSAHPSVSAC
jgi:casein kinase II subunit beta